MTKQHWKEILLELQNFRKSNFLSNKQLTYHDNVIDKVNSEQLYIRFVNRKYLTHKDVINIKPNTFKSKILVTLSVFSVKENIA